MKKIRIYDYPGTYEELKRELRLGLDVQNISRGGNGIIVEYQDKRTGGRPMRFDKELMKSMRAKGNTYQESADAVGCSKSYAVYVCKEKGVR